MKIWIERATAAFRWVWDAIAWRVKWVLNRLDSMYYDPPPLSYKRMLYGALVLLLTVFVTYHLGRIAGRGGHVSVQSFTSEVGLSFPEVGYLLPEPEPLPELVTRLPSVPSVEVVCHDMSDTPQCEPVKPEVTEVIPAPIVEAPVVKKAVDTKRKIRIYRRKAMPYQTYWGF